MLPVAIVLAVFGVLTLLLALSRWLAGRRRAAGGHLLLAALLIAGALELWPIVQNLGTYQVLRPGHPIALVYCERTGSRTHRITLTGLPEGHMRVYEVAGDEWRLDSRTLTWKGLAVDLGLVPRFRLERLSTRFRSPAEPAQAAPSSFALGDTAGDDVWAQARTGTRWADYAVAGSAAAPWTPLAQGARYEVWLVDGRLEARPANEAANKALPARS